MNLETPIAARVAPKTHVAWPHLVLSGIGIALSIYAVWAHGRIEAGQSAGCTLSASISCDEVLGSKWGKFLGIPLGYFGILFWVSMLLTSFTGPKVEKRLAVLQRLALASVGLITSVFYFYIAHFVIEKTCPICLSTHITSLANFIFAVAAWRKIAQPKAPEI